MSPEYFHGILQYVVFEMQSAWKLCRNLATAFPADGKHTRGRVERKVRLRKNKKKLMLNVFDNPLLINLKVP